MKYILIKPYKTISLNKIKMKKLVEKLLSEGEVELFREKDRELPKEKEILYKRVDARILKGNANKLITINLYHEVDSLCDDEKIIPNETECYGCEEVYRIPYTQDKKLLTNILNIAKNKIHSYNANRV